MAEEQDIQQIQQAVDGTQPQAQAQDVAAAMPPAAPQAPDPNQVAPAAGMEPSMMQQAPVPEAPAPQTQEQNIYQDYGQAGYDPYAGGGGGGGVSADSIADIAEQAVAERLSKVREALEETLDFKTTMESKVLNMDERLKKLEKIIDRLQLSILQKIGEHVQNTEDIKKELHEQQKTFKALTKHTPTHRTTHTPAHHTPVHHTPNTNRTPKTTMKRARAK
jgi:hypothetical protein